MSNTNKKIIIISYSSCEYLEDLFKDCIVKGDKEACLWFNYYFYENPYGVKSIYTNSWNIADLKYNYKKR